MRSLSSFIDSLTDPAAGVLPVFETLGEVAKRLTAETRLVLQAPPGSGKTTIVPLRLLDAPWLGQRRIVMLQPRRVAARAVAQRMSELLGETVGGTVGYSVRFERKVSRDTRIEVVTEGILTRMLQSDPSLENIGLVIFDEFHERSIHADLSLALIREAQEALRPDLRVLVMSATLATEPLAGYLRCAVVEAQGRPYPVDVHYLERDPSGPIENYTAKAVLSALQREAGNILAFLPAVRDIHRIEAALSHVKESGGAEVLPLYGELPYERQKLALSPPPASRRRIILSTPIAETSLTIEGVRIVVDTGLHRTTRFDPGYGFDRLVTERISQDSAEQRAGRAGRLGPGVCYRLWSRHTHDSLRPNRTPEILQADLAPLVQELALWGAKDPLALSWLDNPPAAALEQAQTLLEMLGVLDSSGALTPLGRQAAALGAHPRLGVMLCRAAERGAAETGAALAALLEERDLFTPGELQSADIEDRLELLLEESREPRPPRGVERKRLRSVTLLKDRRLAELRRLSRKADEAGRVTAGELLVWAFPDRIGLRRTSGRDAVSYQLSGGGAAELAIGDPLSKAELVVAARLQHRGGAESRLQLGAPLSFGALRTELAHSIRTESQVQWDAERQSVRSERVERLGALILSRQADPASAASAAVAEELLRGLKLSGGLRALTWSAEAGQLQERVNALQAGGIGEFPDLSFDALEKEPEAWLGPYIEGLRSLSELRALNLENILRGMLSWEQQQLLDKAAPRAISLPNAKLRSIEYSSGQAILKATVQELFGWHHTPQLGNGALELTFHIQSPARRPLQITRDLAHFWKATYPQVRKELRGRYPKHRWPEDPLE